MEQKVTEPTRYLCAAVQIDENFCDQVIKEFFEEDYTVIGICYGVDIPTILRSCLLAKKRRRKRDNRLAISFLFLLITLFIFPFISLILYLIAWRVVFLYQRTSRYEIVGKRFLKGNFDPEFLNLLLDPQTEKKLTEIAKTQDANVIIYGGFSPFIGFGLYIDGWSFAIDISKGKEDIGSGAKPLPFKVSELYDYISDKVSDLELSCLSIEDNLYISGQEIRDRKEFLPDPLMRPITRVEDAFVKSFLEKASHSIRHYRCIRVTDWKGEVVLSILLRFTKIRQNLFIEANYYLLTPLAKYYRQFDAIKPQASFEDIRNLAFETAFTTIKFGIASLISPFQPSWNNPKTKKSYREEKEKEIMSNPAYNYGAVNSLRERISYNNEYHRYFQKLDQEMYLKVLERRIIDGLLKFLDSKKIDTSDLKETKSTILNHGVMVSGGSIQSQNLTVGKQAISIFDGAAGGTSRTSDKL